MLIAEDLEYKNKQFNDIKIKPKNEKKILKQKKEKHKEDIKIKKETIEKKDKGNMTSKIPINKIKPQSKTITKLMNENNNKKMIKIFKKE